MANAQHVDRREGSPVTSADVARAAGVSRGAVSQILNGRGERFASATRDRVQEAARSLNYLPSVAGRALASGTSDIVVAIVPNTTFGSQLQDLFDVLTDELSQAGFSLVLRFSSSSVTSLDRLVAGIRPRAVLVLGPLGDGERELLTARGVDLVEPAEPLTARDDPNRAIGSIQADHLVARGHRRLAFAHHLDDRTDPFGTGRLSGFADRCAELGLPNPPVIRVPLDRDAAIHELTYLDRGVAVACYNDEVALTLVGAAAELGWSVPEDLAVIGVDNTPLGRVLSPRLTTVAYDSADIAQDFARGVLGSLLGGRPRTAIALDLRIEERETT